VEPQALELPRRDSDGRRSRDFLVGCGLPRYRVPQLLRELHKLGDRLGGAVLQVRIGPGVPEADIQLRNVEILRPAGVDSPRFVGTRAADG